MKTTKFYKVLLLEGHNAKEDQIQDGYLGNAFGCGRIEEYSRGEAIKKARMFGGKIELAREVKYLYLMIEVQDGDRGYDCKETFSLDVDIDVDKFAEEYAQTFMGDESTVEERSHGNGWYWDDAMETMCRLYTHREITEEEYETLRQYI